MSKPQWVSVREYAKLKKLKSPQIVYNWIDKGKLKKDIQWRIVKITKTKKEVKYE